MSSHIVYLDSAAIGGTGDGSSWANAYTQIALCFAGTGGSVSNIVWMDKDHQELFNSNTVIEHASTSVPYPVEPIAVYRMDKATNEYSPTSQDGTGIVNLGTTGNFDLEFETQAYFLGVKISAGGDLDTDSFEFLAFEDCELSCAEGPAISGDMNFTPACYIRAINCMFRFPLGGAGSTIDMMRTTNSMFHGCRFVGNSSASGLFSISTNGGRYAMSFRAINCDFSGLTNDTIVKTEEWGIAFGNDLAHQSAVFEYCLFRDSYILASSAIVALGDFIRTYACGTTSQTGAHRLELREATGVVATDEVVRLTNGFVDADGNTPLSYRMASSVRCSIHNTLKSPWFGRRLSTLGIQTITVKALVSGGWTLARGACWLEISKFNSDAITKVHDFSNFNVLDAVALSTTTDVWKNPPPASAAVEVTATLDVEAVGLHYVRLHLGGYVSATNIIHINPEMGLS